MGTRNLDAAWTVTLGGVPLTVIPDPSTKQGDETESDRGSFETQDSTRTLAKRDVPVYLRTFSKGAGFVERRDEDDDGGFAWAEGMLTHLGRPTPAGRRQRVYNSSSFPPESYANASAELGANFWLCIYNASFVLRYPNSDPSAAPATEPAAGVFAAGGGFHSGFLARHLAVFTTAAGTPALYVGTWNQATGEGRLYQWTAAGGWTAGAASLAYRFDWLATVWWQDRTGVGAERLQIQVADSVIRHVIQGTDPLDVANLVTPITVGNAAYPIYRLEGAPTHLYAIKADGPHDITPFRSPNMAPYHRETSGFNGLASIVYDDHLYVQRGFGIDRVYLGNEGVQQRISGECGPMAYMQDGTPIRGFNTALAQHDGWLLAAIHNPDNQTSYVMRGKDRRVLNVDGPGPLAWFGAEAVVPPASGGAGYGITHMAVTAPPSGSNFYAPRAAYLWLCSSRVNGANTEFVIDYLPVPVGSGPGSLLAFGGTFQCEPTSRIYFTSQNWSDGNAVKSIRRYDFSLANASATATVQLKSRADGNPLTIGDQSTWKDEGTVTTNDGVIVPATDTQGRHIALQAVVTVPSPYTSPPQIKEISPRAKIIREVFKTEILWIVCERHHELDSGAEDIRDPDAVFDAVAALQDQGRVVYVDKRGVTRSALVEQGITFSSVMVDDHEYRTVARVEISLVD